MPMPAVPPTRCALPPLLLQLLLGILLSGAAAAQQRQLERAKPSEHWSLQPLPEQVAVPAVQNTTWPRNAIDHFVLAALEHRGLAPAPATGRERWLRRVSLTLTGLPPSLAELDAFRADPRPDAHARVLDRLLHSPRYGERMASDWLDLARYADTYGYQADVYRPVWPWRDWVVDAFDRNLPYDAFLTQQLAGDLLPDATREEILATAFNRLHRQTNEGGSVEEEYRVEYVADRVHTFGTAFLGLTLECARCHDHKFDPLSQREYYALFAYFQNQDESGLYSHFTDATPTPALTLGEPRLPPIISSPLLKPRQTWRALMACVTARGWMALIRLKCIARLAGRVLGPR
jgi:hypothetical protein